MAIFFILLTFLSTFLGGFLSFRYKDRLHLILGFTAGVLLGVVAFDLLPEIIDSVNSLGIEPIYPMMALVVGFFLFHSVEKWLLIHHAHEEAYGPHTHPTVGTLSALAIIGHSFLDGMGIGLGFQISPEVGIPVAIAVISHAFSDGLNTVNLMLLHKNPDKKALKFLFMNAVAPVLGGLSTIFFTFSEQFLTLYLGFFAGFFLYIGASEVLPEAHSRDSSFKTVIATLFGVLLVFLATRLG